MRGLELGIQGCKETYRLGFKILGIGKFVVREMGFRAIMIHFMVQRSVLLQLQFSLIEGTVSSVFGDLGF